MLLQTKVQTHLFWYWVSNNNCLFVSGIESALKRSKAYIDAGQIVLAPMQFLTTYNQELICCFLRHLQNYLNTRNLQMHFQIYQVPMQSIFFFVAHRIELVLANITEFGKTPLFTVEELKSVNVSIILYPLSAFRAMSSAALDVYQNILKDGTQKRSVDKMQTREDLYKYLDYHSFEDKLDALFGAKKNNEWR